RLRSRPATEVDVDRVTEPDAPLVVDDERDECPIHAQDDLAQRAFMSSGAVDRLPAQCREGEGPRLVEGELVLFEQYEWRADGDLVVTNDGCRERQKAMHVVAAAD